MVLLVPLSMLKRFLVFTPFLLLACSTEAPYQIEAQDINLLNDENCSIQHHYPQISGLSDSLLQEGLNRYLRETTGLFRASADCLKDSTVVKIHSDYTLHTSLDTLLSIELVRKTSDPKSGKENRTYYPLTVKFPEGYFLPLEFTLDETQWAEMQSKLKSWQSIKPKERRYNEASYIWGDSDLIPYCLSADSLIVFPGGEGENHSWHRLSIPLTDLQ